LSLLNLTALLLVTVVITAPLHFDLARQCFPDSPTHQRNSCDIRETLSMAGKWETAPPSHDTRSEV